MAACLNGIAAHGGLRGFGSTFLVFSDYMKPAIRLAAIMRLPVIYIGTHDSIGLGEDGPTHQPVEHLAMLRAIPNLVVLRPADATETVEAWRVAMERTDGPTLLVLTRQKLPVFDRATLGAADGSARGAYVLLDRPGGNPQAILIATGVRGPRRARGRRAASGRTGPGPGRVDAVLGAVRGPARGLSRRGAAARRTGAGRRSRRPAPSAGSGGSRNDGAMVAMEGFGASAPGDRLFEEFKFTAERAPRRSCAGCSSQRTA